MAINWPKIEYVEAEDGMLYPKLDYPKQPADSIGRYGEMRRKYLQEHRKTTYSLMVLEKLPPEEEELYDNLLEVYNASKEAKHIISRLNDLSRKQSETSFRMVSLDDIISHTMKVAGPAKPKTVTIQQKLNCWGQRIRANEIQLSQLVLNLVLNAFHAMEEGGQLIVETSFDDQWAYLRVTDTGCGIPEENKPRIFEPFFTTKETGKGTGLGLAIAAQTVEDHNGQIYVDSTEGKGTTFTVRLPRE